jgi:ribonuclease P protein component
MMRAARLRRSNDIRLVRADGRAIRRSAFAARVLRRDGPARVAVTAARTIGTAVVRNRARRRVREAIRRELVASKAAGFDMLVTLRPDAVSASSATLASDAAALLREAAS